MSIRSDASFTLGSVDFSADGYDVYVTAEETNIPPFAPPRLDVSQITGASGGVGNGSTFNSQELTVGCYVYAGDGDVETRLSNIWAAIKAHHEGNEEELLTVGAWPARQYYVRLSDVGKVVETNNGATFVLTFIALYPRI